MGAAASLFDCSVSPLVPLAAAADAAAEEGGGAAPGAGAAPGGGAGNVEGPRALRMSALWALNRACVRAARPPAGCRPPARPRPSAAPAHPPAPRPQVL